MTYPTSTGRHRALLSAGAIALAALALGGCSATHVGDAWQCPLAQGAACESVAAADPAVPESSAKYDSLLRTPLYTVRGEAGAAGETSNSGRGCDADCAGFDPFAWLAKLFVADGERDEIERPGDAPSATETALPSDAVANAPALPLPAESPAADAATDDRTEAAALLRPDAPDPEAAALSAETEMEDLRTGEVVARIWIAPFVDADGVYREASYVRVVLEPSGWRLR